MYFSLAVMLNYLIIGFELQFLTFQFLSFLNDRVFCSVEFFFLEKRVTTIKLIRRD